MLTVTATELSRVMRCIGSILMERAVPEPDNDEARSEGNAADWLAEQMFNDRHVTSGTKAPNGWVITDDMIDYITEYVDALSDQPGAMQVVTTWGTDAFEVRGRADWLGYNTHTNELRVRDLKYGHRIVSPVDNWTLLSHAIGFCIRNNVQPDRIEISIHQPRPYHPEGPLRRWVIDYPGLIQRHDAISQTLTYPTDALTTGEQCNKCHARYDCPALDKAAWSAVEATATAFNDNMSNDALAFERDQFEQAANMLKIKIDAVEELMTHRIKSGQVINGYAMQQRQGNRRFVSGLTAHAISAALGVDLTTDKMPTPAEAERRGVNKDVLAALTERPNIGTKLTKIDPDAVARRAFGDR